ncbi:hypothetical protein GCM10009554_07940 [Kribbella koreensis]|uniref:Uncharacterized protein n=2 Tax=Kribbella TaxID=182639 RepID=A0ABP6XK40_9ACTN
MVDAQRGTGAAARRECADLDFWMHREQPQQLSPGVPTGSSHRDRQTHVNEYVRYRMIIQP